MRIRIVCLPLFLFALAVLSYTTAFAQDKSVQIDELMTLYNSYGQFNGSILVAESGRVIYKKGHGLANMEWKIPNEPDTKFRIGSITKQFTAVIILQLAEQGKIKLNGTISAYLPEYRKDIGGQVTIHQLLNHTSGIPSYTDQPGFFDTVSRNPFTVADFVKDHTSGVLEFEPGTKFKYNNSGYFLLGAIAEKVSGKTYEQLLKANIFSPLGMKNSGYDLHTPILEKRASGYTKVGKGYVNAPYLDMSIPYSAGSLYSTVEDLYLWDQALYGEKILSSKSKELMFKPGLEAYGYGFGITNVSLANSKIIPVISHTGGINGFSTDIVRYTGDKHLIVMLDNTAQGRNLDKVKAGITRILYGEPYDKPKLSIADDLYPIVMAEGSDAAIKRYRKLKTEASPTLDFSESELNTLGYRLLSDKRIMDAIEVFKLNVEMFPMASNPHDSLGEVYLAGGQKILALKNYKRAYELDPKNANAGAIVKRLESPEVKVDAKVLKIYVGRYELAPNFILTVTAENDKLMAQATGQPQFELMQESENRFAVAVVNATVTFIKDEKGEVNSLILTQGGRDIPGKRLP